MIFSIASIIMVIVGLLLAVDETRWFIYHFSNRHAYFILHRKFLLYAIFVGVGIAVMYAKALHVLLPQYPWLRLVAIYIGFCFFLSKCRVPSLAEEIKKRYVEKYSTK
ncbi:MAG: hypothetical protein HYV32_03290 [Candidatus Kerfeldbacteria bacterium]|nr:hypothetical protein [Candidatus Kerfeldbacteria bacterium]